MEGVDLLSIPLQRIALLWWPGDVAVGPAELHAETPSGSVDLTRW